MDPKGQNSGLMSSLAGVPQAILAFKLQALGMQSGLGAAPAGLNTSKTFS